MTELVVARPSTATSAISVERGATHRHKDRRKTPKRASPAMEILVDAKAKNDHKDGGPGKPQDRPGHATDPGEPFGRRSLGEMNAAGGQRELLSLLVVPAARWADGAQPK